MRNPDINRNGALNGGIKKEITEKTPKKLAISSNERHVPGVTTGGQSPSTCMYLCERCRWKDFHVIVKVKVLMKTDRPANIHTN
jgi:hypothetical protein